MLKSQKSREDCGSCFVNLYLLAGWAFLLVACVGQECPTYVLCVW